MVTLRQVDAFTSEAFGGNPAAVCLLDDAADAGWMQAVAAEMNLSETAFVVADGAGFGLRWFTPTVEVDLCGHATLASAHVLWEDGVVDPAQPIVFHTLSGTLRAERLEDGFVAIDLPAEPVTQIDVPLGMTQALGTDVVWAGRGTAAHLVIEVASADVVRSLAAPELTLVPSGVNGLIVTARGDGGAHYVCRYFAPHHGIPEDPVTGAAQCALGPLWAQRLGVTDLVAHQLSARGGVIGVHPRGDRVVVSGRAVTVLRGELLV